MRADLYLFSCGHTKSRQAAKLLIENGGVLLDGKTINKPSFEIDETTEHSVQILQKQRFVSRGGEKLDFALDRFSLDVKGAIAIDVGASTGGFTDCLLQRGAERVYAVDSGHGQLDATLSSDERVVLVEKYNARYMKKEDFPCLFDIAVMDVSFISQTQIHAGVYAVLKEGGAFVSLIKPQFEAGRSALNSKGVVKNASYHKSAIERVLESARAAGFSCADLIASPIEGGDGNVEYLAYFIKEKSPKNLVTEIKIKNTIKAK